MDRWLLPSYDQEEYDDPVRGQAYFKREIHLSPSDANRTITSMRKLETVLLHPDTIRTHEVKNINMFSESMSVPSNIYFGENYKQAHIKFEYAPYADDEDQEGRSHIVLELLRDEKNKTCIVLDLFDRTSIIEPIGPDLPNCAPEDVEALQGPDEPTVYTLMAELLGPKKSQEFLTDELFINTPIFERYTLLLKALSEQGSATITESLFLEDRGDETSNTQTYGIYRYVNDPEYSKKGEMITPYALNFYWEQDSYVKCPRDKGRPIREDYQVQILPKSNRSRKNTLYTIASANYAAGLHEFKALVDDELRKWVVASFIGKSALLGGITNEDGTYAVRASFADEVEQAVDRAQLSAMV